MRWTVVQAAEALGVAAPSGLDPSAGLAGVSIDSRTIQPGELFVAIHGPNHDGHDHVAACLGSRRGRRTRGAGALSQISPRKSEERLFAVGRHAGRLCNGLPPARAKLAESGGREAHLAAVAGSVGKTTTKEILAALVGARFRVLKTQGNLNNEYGLPLTLLETRRQLRSSGRRTWDVASR